MYARFLAAALAAIALATCSDGEHWPEHVVTHQMRDMGVEAVEEYHQKGYDPDVGTEVPFVAGGDYLNYGKWMFVRKTDNITFDDKGLPLQRLTGGSGYYYNPVQVSNYALGEYGRAVVGGDDAQFMRAAEMLLWIQSQHADGTLPINSSERHFSQAYSYKPGWVDGMTPGMVLSVYARAYERTKQHRWLEAGNKLVKAIQIPFPAGAMSTMADLDPSLSDYIFFQEYPTDPQNFTLNGFMFALLGLYEWSEIGKSAEARALLQKGITTLEKVLPYYDLGTFSSYDLAYITYGRQWYLRPQVPRPIAFYHAVHIYQLRALQSVTSSPILKEYADRWLSYVQSPGRAPGALKR